MWLQTRERWRLLPPCPESCAAGRALIASSWRCTKQKQSQSQRNRKATAIRVWLVIFRGVCVGAAISSLATRPPQLLNCSTALSVAAASASDLVRSRKWQLDHRDQTTNKTTHAGSPPFFISTSSRLFYQSIKQASKQAINQSSDREPAPPPVLFCSLLAAPHHPSCHRDAASAPRRSRLQKQLLMPLLIECHHRDRGARYLRMSPWPPSHVVLRQPRHGVPSQCVLQ